MAVRSKPRVLVTGGAGFIGSNLIRRLADAGWQTVVLDDFSTGSRHNLADTQTQIIEGSVGDGAALAYAMKGVNAAVHLAAETSVLRSMAEPMDCHDNNVTSPLRLLDMAYRKRIHVILASSAAVYGDQGDVPLGEASPTAPLSPYGASKLAMEQYGSLYSAAFGARVLILRLFNVFGPRQDPDRSRSVVSQFVRAAVTGERLTMYGTGVQSRDFVPVSFVTRVIHRALVEGLTLPGPVNVGSGVATSVNSLALRIQALTDRELPVVYLPERAGEIRYSCADVGLLHRLLPRLGGISLDRELRDTATWIAQHLGALQVSPDKP